MYLFFMFSLVNESDLELTRVHLQHFHVCIKNFVSGKKGMGRRYGAKRKTQNENKI
jgi:hypothetical protein